MELGDDLLKGLKAIADYLKESERSTHHLICKGHIPVIRKGRSLYARKSALDRSFSAAA